MRHDRLYLQDIRERIAVIQQRIAGKSVEEFLADDVVRDSVLLQLSVIGEAAANIPRDLRNKYNAVPWGSIVAMRNIIVHAYFSIDLPVIWETVTRNLNDLDTVVQQMLAREFPESPTP
jgi:uncharacterized protein with HEPN domain